MLLNVSAIAATALNSGSSSAFTLWPALSFACFGQRLERFRQDFPEVTWQVEPTSSFQWPSSPSLQVRGALNPGAQLFP